MIEAQLCDRDQATPRWHGPEVCDLCHTFLHDARAKKPVRVRKPREISRARVFFSRASCKMGH